MEILQQFMQSTGFVNLTLGNAAMIVIGMVFITLAITKDYEPLLLVPIGMGIVVGNIPPVEGMSLSVYDEGSVLSYIYFGVKQGVFPPLIFLGIGAMTDFSTMLSNPKLVLLGATFHFDSYPSDVRDFISNYEWDGNTDPTKFPGNFIKHYLSGHDNLDDFGRLLKEMATMWTTSPAYIRSDLQKIEANTLIINGDREDTILEHAIELYAGITNSQLFVVPGGTHYSLQEKPELVNDVVMKFLTDEN